MFLPRISRPNCTAAWLEASKSVYGLASHEAHNVVIDVADPVRAPQDDAIIREVDRYLTAHSRTGFLVDTVSNTIFPQAIYDEHGAPNFYDVYMNDIFPRLKRSPNDWGRYFERMIAYRTGTAKLNLLSLLVNKMKRNVNSDSTYRNIYELPVYNPISDAEAPPRGRQCLSYLSFKLDKEHRLLLSAIYRNHYYTERLLGNLVGLGQLMQFVASESGVAVGSLTILSTHAEVDTCGATHRELRALHDTCTELVNSRDAQSIDVSSS